MRLLHNPCLSLLPIVLLGIGTPLLGRCQTTDSIKGAVKVASLPINSDSHDVWSMEWLSNTKIKIISSKLAGRKDTWYTIDVRSGQKSAVHSFKLPSIDSAEVITIHQQWRIPGNPESAELLGDSPRHTLLFTAPQGDNWRDIQEPIDIFEMKDDHSGKLLHKWSLRIPVEDSIGSLAIELSPDGRRILWCFVQEMPSQTQNRAKRSKKETVTFWISDYQGRYLRLLGAIAATADAEDSSEEPRHIVWCPDSRHASFLRHHGIWRFPVP